MGDLGSGEAAEGVQRERHLGLQGQSGVAAGKEELQALVGDLVEAVEVVGRSGERALQRLHAHTRPGAIAPAQPVQGFASRHGEHPGAGTSGNTGGGPVLQGGHEGVLEHILGQLKVAQPADQGGEQLAGLGAEGPLDGLVGEGHALAPLASVTR